MRHTVLLLAEVEIEDEGFITDCVNEQIAAGGLSDIRIATARQLVANKWDRYLIPRLDYAKKIDSAINGTALTLERPQ